MTADDPRDLAPPGPRIRVIDIDRSPRGRRHDGAHVQCAGCGTTFWVRVRNLRQGSARCVACAKGDR